MSMGQRFKKFRQTLNKTQSELAEPYHCTRQIISFIESDKSKPNLQFLYQLSFDHNLNIHWLITGEGSMFGNEVPNLRDLNAQAAARKDQDQVKQLERENRDLQRKLIQCQERLVELLNKQK